MGLTSWKLGTPWAVSLAIHGTLVGVLALVAVGVALEPTAGPERYIDFDDAGAEPLIEERPARAAATTDAGAVAAEEVAAPSPVLPAPVLPTAPPGGVAPSETPDDEGVSLDAWLTPSPVSSGPAADVEGGEAGEDAGAGVSGRALGGEVTFAGLGSSNARSVVYVVDASGPMVSTLREVIDEVDRSVSRLSATQRFGVIAFGERGEEAAASFMPVLVRATPQAKRELREWLLGLTPSGRSNPLSGLRAALKMKPDAVFLLSRGIERSEGGVWELGLDKTMEELERLNPVQRRSGRRGVVVKTIQFLDEDPTGTMQRIGQLHGASTNKAGVQQLGYRVIRRESELSEAPALEVGR